MNRNYLNGFSSVLPYRMDKGAGTGKPCGKGFISSDKKCGAGQGTAQKSATKGKRMRSLEGVTEGEGDQKKEEVFDKPQNKTQAIDQARIVLAAALIGLYTYAVIEEVEAQKRQQQAWDEYQQQWNNYRETYGRGGSGGQQSKKSENTREWWKVLGVDKNASKEDIKKAYKKKARDFHPDINKDPKATEWMQEVNNAMDDARSRGKADSLFAVERRPIAWC